MDNCPYCDTIIVDDLNFCIECEQQVKCLSCGGLLHKNKTKCLRCGEHLKLGSSSTNSYTLEEKTTKSSTYRRIELVASNSAVETFASRLPLGNFNPLRTFDGEFKTLDTRRLLAEPQTTGDPIPEGDESEQRIVNTQDSRFSPNISIEIGTLFSDHSQFEIIPSKSLRSYILNQLTKKDKQQKFAMLYVWGFNQRTGRNITRNELIAILKHESLHDGNTNRHLNALINDYFVVNGNNYRINDYDGKEKIDEILDEIKNPKPKAKDKETNSSKRVGRPAGSPNKKELEIIGSWLEMNIDLPTSFDVRRLGGATDWTLFAIYVLTKLLKVDETVNPGTAYAFISKKYPILSVKRKNFINTLSRDKSNVQRSVSGGYSLTERGEAKIKQLIENN